MERESGILALFEVAERHAPGRLLVLTPNSHLARWTQRAMLDVGPILGAELHDTESFLLQVASARLGEAIPHRELLSLVREVLSKHSDFQAVAAEPTYLNIVLRQFVEIHRACGGGPTPPTPTSSRDAGLLEAFQTFRSELSKTYPGRWYAGNAPSLLAPLTGSVPLIRDTKGIVLFGFLKGAGGKPWLNAPAWLTSWLASLGKPVTEIGYEHPSPINLHASLLACSSPEVEMATVARLLRREVNPTAVFVPADEIPRWARRLGHRDIPLRAFLPRPFCDTAVAKMFTALSASLTTERVDKSDLGILFFGPALRAFSWAEEQLKKDDPIPEAFSRLHIHQLWKGIRRRSGSLNEWIARIRSVIARKERGWEIQDQKKAPSEDDLKSRALEWRSCNALILCLQKLQSSKKSCLAVRRLLKDWQIDQSAYAKVKQDPDSREVAAASFLLEELETAKEHTPDLVLPLLCDRVNALSDGHWIDEVPADGTAPIWLVPYEAAQINLPSRVILCGLDRVPAPVPPPSLLSLKSLDSMNILTDQDRYESQVLLLDNLTRVDRLVISWRAKDALGAACTPSAWTASRFPLDLKNRHAVNIAGAECLAAPMDESPLSWLERQVQFPEGELAQRVSAIASCHFEEKTNGYAGDLGVSFKPPYYSVSALQKYAAMPYAYFLNYVLKLSEEREAEDSLDAAEQGTLLHAAMESPLRARLQTASSANVCLERKLFREQTQKALGEEYESNNDQVLSEAVWKGDYSRWQIELDAWWKALEDRMDRGPKEDPRLFVSFKQAHNGELDSWYQKGNAAAINGWWNSFQKSLFVLQGEEGKPIAFPKLNALTEWFKLKSTATDPQWQMETTRSETFGPATSSLRKAVEEWLKPEEARDQEPIRKLEAEFGEDIRKLQKTIQTTLSGLLKSYVEAPGCEVVAVEMSLGTKETPLRIRLDEDLEISITGFIDRLEWDPVRARLCICDYKTGGSHNAKQLLAKISKGEHLQLPLYALAVDTMDETEKEMAVAARPLKVGAIRLEFMKRKKGVGYQSCALSPSQPSEEGEDEDNSLSVLDVAKERAAEIVRAIESGSYPMEARTDTAQFFKREREVMRVVREGKQSESKPATLPESEGTP